METYSPAKFDDLLADAGYRVLSSDLRHVADQLEALDSVMLTSGDWAPPDPDSAHYNPSDLASWVDSMLDSDPNPIHIPSAAADTCKDQTDPLPPQLIPIAPPDEDSAIRLVRLLVSCSDSIQRGDHQTATTLLSEIAMLLTRVGSTFGIGKVASHFAGALLKRLYPPPSPAATAMSATNDDILYHSFYEASPSLKFAHFTANQAILEAVSGCDRIHVVDFGLGLGLQWPALIQALALRPGGPPSLLRLTAVGPHSPDGRDPLREIGLRLADLARSVNVRFNFRGIAANRLDDVKPWMLHVAGGEVLAINSVFQLHRILRDPGFAGPIDSVLEWIVDLRPRIVTVVEQEADHNKPGFLDRFSEALFYYSAVFDSLEGGRAGREAANLAEIFLQKEICNIVCCEGPDRVERHEPLLKWRGRLGRAGLRPVHLGSNAFKQASMLLALYSGEGFGVEEVEGCLTLGWHNRPLIWTSAWRAGDDVDVGPIPESLIFNSSDSYIGAAAVVR